MHWNATQWSTIATLIATAVGVVSLLISVRRAAVRQREDELEKLRAEYNRGHLEGRASRKDEIDLLRSQRDDARDQRDQARQRADEYERRYNDLRDHGGH